VDTLEFTKNLAKEAGAIMRQNFSLGMKKEWKDDETPVTKTDLAINQLVLEAIEREFPDHSYIGEEGSNIKESEFTWVCDPVDGTVPFSHGYPTFAFSLALVKDGAPILGVIYDPIMDRLLWAEKGKGAFLNGGAISVSKEAELSPRTYVEMSVKPKVAPLKNRLIEKGVPMPHLYSCVYAGMLVATGEFAAALYSYNNPWDAAAVKIIVEEAGGRVTSLSGEEQRYDRDINGFVASNGLVHEEMLRYLNG